MANPDLQGTILAAWRTNNRITTSLIQHVPDHVWEASVPGIGRRTVRTIAAHLHNARSRWIKTLGADHGIGGRVPPSKYYVWQNLPLDVGHVLDERSVVVEAGPESRSAVESKRR